MRFGGGKIDSRGVELIFPCLDDSNLKLEFMVFAFRIDV
jgi:hypothetical protein